jgi:hypothetical protein
VLLCLITLMIWGTLRNRLPTITQYPRNTATNWEKLKLPAAAVAVVVAVPAAAQDALPKAVAGSANAKLAFGGVSLLALLASFAGLRCVLWHAGGLAGSWGRAGCGGCWDRLCIDVALRSWCQLTGGEGR